MSIASRKEALQLLTDIRKLSFRLSQSQAERHKYLQDSMDVSNCLDYLKVGTAKSAIVQEMSSILLWAFSIEDLVNA